VAELFFKISWQNLGIVSLPVYVELVLAGLLFWLGWRWLWIMPLTVLLELGWFCFWRVYSAAELLCFCRFELPGVDFWVIRFLKKLVCFACGLDRWFFLCESA